MKIKYAVCGYCLVVERVDPTTSLMWHSHGKMDYALRLCGTWGTARRTLARFKKAPLPQTRSNA